MKVRTCATWAIFGLFAVTVFALVPTVAWAGQLNCTTSTCDFAGLTALASVSSTMSPASGAWTGTFTENVYENGSGVYIYVFELQITTIKKGDSLSSSSTGLGLSALNLFNSSLNYGFVTNVTSPTVSGSFNFTASTLQVNSLTGMNAAGETLEFYAESTIGPGAGQFNVLNGGTTTAPALDPTPEPASLSLLGSGLLVIGGLLRKKLMG